MDEGRLQYIQLVRRVNGVQVRDSRIVLAVKLGNLIYVNGSFLDDMAVDTEPTLGSCMQKMSQNATFPRQS